MVGLTYSQYFEICANKNLTAFKKFFKKNTDLNESFGPYQDTIFHIVAKCNFTEVIDYLYSLGECDPNIKNKDNLTVFDIAKNNPKFFEKLQEFEINYLQNQNNDLEKTLENKNSEIAEKERKEINLNNVIDDLNETKTILKEDITSFKRKIRLYESEKNSLNKTISKQESKINDLEFNNRKLKNEITSVESENLNLKTQIENLSNQLNETKSEYEKLDQSYGNLISKKRRREE